MRSGPNEVATDVLRPILSQLQLGRGCRKIIYVAVPVTSGRRLWKIAAERHLSDISRVRKAFPKEFQNLVLRTNYRDAARLATRVRKRYPGNVVINPSLVSVRTWSQEQYRRAWKIFISRYAKIVVASTGWPFSYGCVDEVTHALDQGIPVFDAAGEPISAAKAYRAIARALAASIRKGLEIPFLARFLKKLEKKINEGDSKCVEY